MKKVQHRGNSCEMWSVKKSDKKKVSHVVVVLKIALKRDTHVQNSVFYGRFQFSLEAFICCVKNYILHILTLTKFIQLKGWNVDDVVIPLKVHTTFNSTFIYHDGFISLF
jgi:hypothetical protein